MKKFIAETLRKLFRAYRKPTKTEEAFMALQSIEKFNMFIENEKLSSHCYYVNQEIIRKYFINDDIQIWEILVLYKEAKELLKATAESKVLIEDGYKDGIELQDKIDQFLNQ